MKQSLALPLIVLSSLSLSGCCLFTATVPVDDAQAFVDEAFKEAMAEVAKLKLRPSKVAFSFYADQDVNAITQQIQPQAQPRPPLNNHAFKLEKPEAETELIKYTLKCKQTRPVTFTDCQVMDSLSPTAPEDRPQLHFKQVQLRKNNRLKISLALIEKSAKTPQAPIEYNLQCDRNEPEFYRRCRSVSKLWSVNNPGTLDLTSTQPISIKQLQLKKNSQLEIMIEHQAIKAPQSLAQQTPVIPVQTPVQWTENYIDPKPISFKVLMLRDDSLLLSADQESLNSDLEETLGKNYIDHDDYVLTPGEFKFIDFSRIDADTRYVGIIADYRDSAGSVWKKAFKVEPTGSTYPLHVHLRRNEVDILAEE